MTRYRRPVSSDLRFRRGESLDGSFPPPERWQHTGRVLASDDKGRHLVMRVLEECALDHLHLRGHITDTHKETGLKLRYDFVCAGLPPHVVRNYAAQSTGRFPYRPQHERTAPQEAAYERWRRAVCAVDLFFTDTVVSACCYDIVPCPAHLVLLQAGLIQLGRWYEKNRKGP
ncbi:MAG: hypothetical protein FWF24_06270 [Alphaproteobacteria bacterium]|nr:hypothetical protein [Alphaproteobacteria bacterium]